MIDELKRLLAEQQREVARLRGMLELDGRELVRIEFTETRQRRQLVVQVRTGRGPGSWRIIRRVER